MKDAFRIKKGLNIAPVDPVSVVNPEAGDLIIDSSDDNKLKVFDEASADWASVGSGGSSGNLMSDFEKLTPTVSNVVATVDTVTYLPIDDNNKSVKAVFSGSNGSIRYQVAAPADLEGTQGVVQLWIKTSVENLQVIATRNGVQYAGPLSVNSSNKWRQYEIPVVFSDADYGFEIKANGSAAGDVFIDEAFVKVDSSMFSKIRNPLTAKTANEFVAFIDPNGFVSGENFDWINGNCTNANPTVCTYKTDLGLTTPLNCQVTGTSSVVSGTFVLNSSTTTGFSVTRYSGGAGSNLSFFVNCTRSTDYVKTPDSSIIVTQNTELTAQTANEFVADITSGVVSNENFDWINGDCAVTDTSLITCGLKSGIFESAPICTVTQKVSTDARGVRVISASNTQIVFRAFRMSDNANLLTSFSVNCTRSTDYRKHATIVGKFENINSSELVKVGARGNGGQAITADVTNITWANKTVDNYNAWNGSQFTAPKSSYYNVTLGLRAISNISATATIHIFINGNNLFRSVYAKVASIIQDAQWDNIYLNKNDVLSIRINTAITLQPDDTYHHITITELPDTESIIKNLSTQKTKCQTKFLSANTSSSGVVSDLTFNSISIGRKYRVLVNHRVSFTGATGTVLESRNNGTNRVCNNIINGSSGETPSNVSLCSFTATSTTLEHFTGSSATATLLGDGTIDQTWVELCELPDTYVETDEW